MLQSRWARVARIKTRPGRSSLPDPPPGSLPGIGAIIGIRLMYERDTRAGGGSPSPVRAWRRVPSACSTRSGSRVYRSSSPDPPLWHHVPSTPLTERSPRNRCRAVSAIGVSLDLFPTVTLKIWPTSTHRDSCGPCEDDPVGAIHRMRRSDLLLCEGKNC